MATTAGRYRDFAVNWTRGHSDLYGEWALGISQDPEVLAMIEALSAPKQQPNLVFAAARFCGSGDVSYGQLRHFLLAEWSRIREVVLERRTQTNEAGRCATLLPAFARIAAAEGKPLALIEVGASAGLCLLPDKYSYRYDGGRLIGNGTPLLECTTSGSVPLPAAVPRVQWRAGIDLHPLDLTDEDDARWLECLVWPGQDLRLRRLREAIATARKERPRIIRGDLNTSIRQLVGEAPEDAAVVVYHSAVLAYVDPEDRQRFARTLEDLGCHWISNENFFLDGQQQTGRFMLVVDGVHVADTGQHGGELWWL